MYSFFKEEWIECGSKAREIVGGVLQRREQAVDLLRILQLGQSKSSKTKVSGMIYLMEPRLLFQMCRCEPQNKIVQSCCKNPPEIKC